jgi:hypothetical protein
MVGEVLLHLVAASALALDQAAQAVAPDLHMVKVNSQGLYIHLRIIQIQHIKWVGIMGAGAGAVAGHGPMQGEEAQVQ